MAGVKLQRSLNAEAPEFFPCSRNNQVDEVSYFASYLQTPQIFSFQNPYLLYHRPSTSYSNTHLSRNKTGFGDLPHAPADVATSSESVPFWVNTPDEETYLTVDEAAEEPQLGVQNGSNYHRKAKRGPYGNRFLWRRRYKQEWRLRRQNGEEGGCSRYGDGENFSRYPRNLHYRVAPPKIKHPVLPLESDGLNTTVMIRNIPNKFTREMLMNFLDDHCKVENEKAQVQNSVTKDEEPALVSAFDFLYLPIDFQNRVNKGYAFVNFTTPGAAWKFYLASHNQPWGAFQSNKIREIASARLQGREDLVRHFEKISFPCGEKEEYLPICFTPARDGSREKVNQRTVGRCAGSVTKSFSSSDG
ncbi:protein MEI2-like 2 [Mangifera indica]|uniref:protein MEI2-like 2 n=1 Tax=Mangifera indica TaxID=29780 RepID=UPI001CF95880|nr:protein MEI2-like 2 [Mangifera indica]